MRKIELKCDTETGHTLVMPDTDGRYRCACGHVEFAVKDGSIMIWPGEETFIIREIVGWEEVWI